MRGRKSRRQNLKGRSDGSAGAAARRHGGKKKMCIRDSLVTMYNGRLNLSTQVMDELKKYYADKLFSTVITRNVRLTEAPSFGIPAYYYDKYSKGSQAYLEVSKELVSRIG